MKGIVLAILAAALYAVSTPCAKLLLGDCGPVMLAALLYLGAGLGVWLIRAVGVRAASPSFTPRERPFVVAMVLLDVAAPILLLWGLKSAAAANVALLNNFEIVATSLVALAFFGERISPRLWTAIILISLACLVLLFDGVGSLSFSAGSFLVLAACVAWGFENNCTRRLSNGDPLGVVIVKGIASGSCSLALAFSIGEGLPPLKHLVGALGLGVVAYGLSILCYVRAQRDLGAARTSAYYAVAPFIGSALSFLVFREWPTPRFVFALAVMLAGAFVAARD